MDEARMAAIAEKHADRMPIFPYLNTVNRTAVVQVIFEAIREAVTNQATVVKSEEGDNDNLP